VPQWRTAHGRRVKAVPNLKHLNSVPPGGLAIPPDAETPYAATIGRTTAFYGLSRSEIYRLLGSGKIKAVKSGRSTLILLDSVKAHLASLPPATIRAPK
jgi:excisionase family DNA binding protein